VEVSRDAPAGASQRGSGGGNESPRHVLEKTFCVSISAHLRRARFGARRVGEREVRREHARAKAPQSVFFAFLGHLGDGFDGRERREIGRSFDAASAAARLGARREVRQRLDIRRGFGIVVVVGIVGIVFFRVERRRAEPALAQFFRRALAERGDDRLEVLGEDPERAQRAGHDAPRAGEARSRAAVTAGAR
jgi:hypothetical protein